MGSYVCTLACFSEWQKRHWRWQHANFQITWWLPCLKQGRVMQIKWNDTIFFFWKTAFWTRTCGSCALLVLVFVKDWHNSSASFITFLNLINFSHFTGTQLTFTALENSAASLLIRIVANSKELPLWVKNTENRWPILSAAANQWRGTQLTSAVREMMQEMNEYVNKSSGKNRNLESSALK